MWKLVIEDEEGKRTVVHLTREEYSVGRKEGHAIRLTERNVSRSHAILRKKNGAAGMPDGRHCYTLHDTQSYNGVFVNGVRLAETQEILHGDLVQIGDYRIVIQDDSVAEAAQPAPATTADAEDLKSTVVPGKVRVTGAQLLQRPNRLVMLIGPTPGAEYPLDKDRIIIGRAEEAHVSVNHNSVSRLHCEVHTLAENRFEIVDKGSSNGVRVNGADLSRGIIEAGDVIELGDVRFKFIGAGQVFVANSTESQQLAAISDRQANAVLGGSQKQSTAVWPFVLVGLLLGGIAVGIVYFLTHQQKQEQSDPTLVVKPSTNDPNASMPGAEHLARAQRMLREGKLDEAHQALTNVPSDSALRGTKDFKNIEGAWASYQLDKAEKEASSAAKLPLLRAVLDNTSIDDETKARAQADWDAAQGTPQTAPTHTAPLRNHNLPDVPDVPPTTPQPGVRPTSPLAANPFPPSAPSATSKPGAASTEQLLSQASDAFAARNYSRCEDLARKAARMGATEGNRLAATCCAAGKCPNNDKECRKQCGF